MDKRKYKKSDKDVRSALWLAYDKKDVYTGDLLRYRELEVDHIIPQEIFKNEERKLDVLNSLGLDSNFEKDSLENFVPTRRGPNSSKGDSIDLILIKNTLNIARKMKSKVEKLIMEYNEECDFINVTTKVAKKDALVVCIDSNREFECDGLYIDGMDYFKLCKPDGLEKHWKSELEQQGRDYAAAIKNAHTMRKLGLKNVDVRMNDKVNFVTPQREDYEQEKQDFIEYNDWNS